MPQVGLEPGAYLDHSATPANICLIYTWSGLFGTGQDRKIISGKLFQTKHLKLENIVNLHLSDLKINRSLKRH